MNGNDLTPEELKRQHAADVAGAKTFETHGVSKQAALDYLETREGSLFLQSLAEADPAATQRTLADRAISQITSGRELPRMEVINEPLVKIVPAGDKVSSFTPFFAKQSEFEDAIAKGHNLNDRFGLPIKSEAPVYDVYRIEPKGPTQVFVSEVAPTSELNGQITRAGGATQHLVPNRSLFTEATHITSIGNDLALHQERVVRRGLGAPIAPLGESALAAETAAARRLRGAGSKALGVAGAAVTAYDAADTLHDASRLRGQGNNTAAQAQIERFAVQNAAGWGGAVAGMGAGALAGVESGPGLLLTGAIGGIVGAVAGDKVADWLDERKINHQQDPQGRTWTFDTKHPERGWTHQERTIDAEAMRYHRRDSIPYKTETLTAGPELSDRLTFQASRTSIELALGSPPQSRDPYTLPANAQDARSAREAPWTRNPETAQWVREMSRVVDYRVNHPVYETHWVEAPPQRATELEQQSQAIIAENANRTPAAMAARFQAVCGHNGWTRYGMPEAVTEALRNPGRVVGSDGDLYERNAQGQWTHDGLLWDSQAKGNLRHELEATYQEQQANTRITSLEPVRVTAPAIDAPESATTRDPRVARFLVALEAGDEQGMREASIAFAESERGQQIFADAEQRVRDRQQQLPNRDHPLFEQPLEQGLQDLAAETRRQDDQAQQRQMAAQQETGLSL